MFAGLPDLPNPEVLPVPPEVLPRVWGPVKRAFTQIPGYDVERLHTRLQVGIDQLWCAYVPYWTGTRTIFRLSGVIVTSISDRPPSKRNVFKRKDPALMKSLTIHLAKGQFMKQWLVLAIERIWRYAFEHGCCQLFLLAARGCHKWIRHFYSRMWEAVAIARDRPTVSKHPRLRFRNTPGYWRVMCPVPADKWHRQLYTYMGTFYFKEAA